MRATDKNAQSGPTQRPERQQAAQQTLQQSSQQKHQQGQGQNEASPGEQADNFAQGEHAGQGRSAGVFRWVFTLSAILLLALAVALGWREYGKKWRQITRQHPAWQQSVVEIVGQAGVDRCATCHQDLLDAATDKVHAQIIKSKHPTRILGCVVCHAGDGHALDFAKAHGRTGAQALLLKSELNTRCVQCHLPGSIAQTQGALRGLQVFRSLGCASCHRLGQARASADAQAGVGPDLDNIGRWTRQDLLSALREPTRAFGKKTEMPSFAGDLQRDPEAAQALLNFLRAQRSDLSTVRARGDSEGPCIACHALQPARGFAHHRCSWIKYQAKDWRCSRCHQAEFLTAPKHGQASCAFINAQRDTCVYCHRSRKNQRTGFVHAL